MRTMLLIVAAVAFGLTTAHAQQRPDFSGEWVLNRATSSLHGETAAVESGVVRIQHREPAFTFQRTFVVNKQSLDASYEIRTDGREIAAASRGLTSRSRGLSRPLATTSGDLSRWAPAVAAGTKAQSAASTARRHRRSDMRRPFASGAGSL